MFLKRREEEGKEKRESIVQVGAETDSGLPPIKQRASKMEVNRKNFFLRQKLLVLALKVKEIDQNGQQRICFIHKQYTEET